MFLLQQTVTVNVTTPPATTTETGTASGGTATTASTVENEETATENATVSATTPADILSGTENASHATGTVIVTATEDVGAVRTTTSTRDVTATTIAGASAEGEVEAGLEAGLEGEVEVAPAEAEVAPAEVRRISVVAGSAVPHGAETRTGASGRGGGGTATGWGHLKGGLRRRRKRCLCRRGSGRRVGGTCTLLGTSSTRPCRLSRQVSDALGYPYGYAWAGGAAMGFAVEEELHWNPKYPRLCGHAGPSGMGLEIDLRSRRSLVWVQSRAITHHHCR